MRLKVTTKSKSRTLWLLILVLLLSLLFPIAAVGQGRGRGRGPDLGKKCGKFVNCHDARDGRWDDRGPRRFNSHDRYEWQGRSRRWHFRHRHF